MIDRNINCGKNNTHRNKTVSKPTNLSLW